MVRRFDGSEVRLFDGSEVRRFDGSEVRLFGSRKRVKKRGPKPPSGLAAADEPTTADPDPGTPSRQPRGTPDPDQNRNPKTHG